VSGTAAAPATLGLSALAGEVGGAGMIGLGIGTIGAGQALSSSASATMKDPPAADYRTIATPGPARGLAFPPASGSLGRTFATAKQLTIEFARAGDLSDALQLSVDRAGGAKAARNELWEGRQIRAAIGYIHQLRLTMHQIRISIPRLLQETSGPAFHPVVSAAEIEAAKKAARLGQFSPKLLTTFAKDGISETALRAGILALPDRTIKVNLVGAIANPALVPYLKILDAGFALYTKVPQIVAESKLR
jgi:hypothetical protein